ncbi:hypothetical protein [Chitinophaga sp. HK235]|uniref:hypothetical protein n=1 Tax=Chitinophaga sp. HK235 TaxID=2952571 RepID=UPI001BA7BD2C|nr:hypothetical protein [Chitinophaga sp. HK235]
MHYLVRHQGFIFLFFTFPLLGWLIHQCFSKKTISYILCISLVLLLPALTGYSYVVDNAYGYLFYILLTFAYALIHKVTEYKFLPTGIISLSLFLLCVFISFMGVVAGTITVERKWKLKGYKIEYIRDQGFAGRPLMTYQLSKYAMIPIFLKHVDTKVDDDTTHTCWIKFADAGFNFNKCSPDSSGILKH